MKKKCTNNKCRKTFVINNQTDCCPYCKKRYPRLYNKKFRKDTELERISQDDYTGVKFQKVVDINAVVNAVFRILAGDDYFVDRLCGEQTAKAKKDIIKTIIISSGQLKNVPKAKVQELLKAIDIVGSEAEEINIA